MMSNERRIVLYEGTDSEKAKEVRKFLGERKVNYSLGIRDERIFKDMPFPIVSEGMVDYYGVERISRRFE